MSPLNRSSFVHCFQISIEFHFSKTNWNSGSWMERNLKMKNLEIRKCVASQRTHLIFPRKRKSIIYSIMRTNTWQRMALKLISTKARQCHGERQAEFYCFTFCIHTKCESTPSLALSDSERRHIDTRAYKLRPGKKPFATILALAHFHISGTGEFRYKSTEIKYQFECLLFGLKLLSFVERKIAAK